MKSQASPTLPTVTACSRALLICLLVMVVGFNLFMFKYLVANRKTSSLQNTAPAKGSGISLKTKIGPITIQPKTNDLLKMRGFDDESHHLDDEYASNDDSDDGTQYYSFVLNENVPNYIHGLNQADECDGSFGHNFYAGWRAGKQTYCRPRTSKNTDFTNSEVVCYRYKQPKHSGIDTFCEMRNVIFDFSKLETMTKSCQQVWDIDGCHRYYDFNQGAMLGNCAKEYFFSTSSKWPIGHFQQLNRPIFNGFEESSNEKNYDVVNNPVLMVARDGAFNTYHSMEDFVNAFIVLEVLKLNPVRDNLELMILDQEVDGPYGTMWRKAFSKDPKNNRLRIVKNWVRKGKKVLFKRVIINLPGISSPVVKDISTSNPCSPMVDLFVNFGRHILKSFGMIVPPRTEEQLMALPSSTDNIKPGATITVNVTIIDRKYHHERAEASRSIDNLDRILQVLRENSEIEIDDVSFKVNINAVDFAKIPFEKQIEISYNTQILIGR